MLTIKRKREARDQDRLQRKRAVIYLREQGDGEADLVKVPSINVQRRICRSAAKDLQADVVDEFI